MPDSALLEWTEAADGSVAPPAGAFLCRRRPAPAFVDDVVEITGYAERRAGHFRQSEPAALIVPMVISFGDPFAIGLGAAPGRDDRFGTFAAGLFAGPAIIESFGASACVQVNFTPLGARRFFGRPMSALSGRMIALDALLGAEGRRLRQRLGEEADWQRRLDLTERFVYTRLAARPAASAAIGHAFARLRAGTDAPRIARLAADLGWSRKHLAARFRDEVGLTPKTVARMMRFNRLLALARRDGGGWADAAMECGYADQAHMTREFLALAGETPGAWNARRLKADDPREG